MVEFQDSTGKYLTVKKKKEKKYVHPQNKPQRTYPKYLEHKQSKVSQLSSHPKSLSLDKPLM